MSWKCEKVSFEKLNPAVAEEDYELHLAAVEWSLAEPIVIASKDDIKSKDKWQEGFEPFHHQVRNLITFCARLPVTLLADDVGLGKTISAALVLRELMERKRVARCLVICPAILGPQWVEELGSKFNIPALHAKGQELSNMLERSTVPVIVTTYQSASNRIGDIRSDQFDMLILDEAHKLRNLHGTSKAPQMAQRVRAALENRTFRYVLMLTATPIQNRVWDLYSLIDLMTVARGHRNPLGNPTEFSSRYLLDRPGRRLNPHTGDEFRSILRQYVVRTRRDDANLVFPERKVKTRELQATQLESKLIEYVKEEIGHLNKLMQISVGQAMMSSPQALARQLENMARSRSVSQRVADAVRRIADANPQTAKLTGLISVVKKLRQERPDDWRLVVFTMRSETQNAIARVLAADGIKVGLIQGGSPHGNQKTVEDFRQSPPQVNVIVSTDAGAEGINLQAGNVLVNYDLPWNPMVMEQRIGRIQRLASVHRNVNIINLALADSAEAHVVARLVEKLQVISQTIGDIEAILELTDEDDESSFEEMIRKLVVGSLLGQDVEEATEKKVESIQRGKELIDETKDEVDSILGSQDSGDEEELVPPSFEPFKPSMSADQFVMKALQAEGCTLRPKADDTIEVYQPGKPVERITFKPEVAEDSESTGVFMGNAPKLYLPGRPPFERLVQRWLQRSGHVVRDLCANTEALALLAIKAWCDSVPDAAFDSFEKKRSTPRKIGGVVCRVKAANGVDSLEKVLRVQTKPKDIGKFDGKLLKTAPVVREQPSAKDTLDDIERLITSAIGDDHDINEFCRYYEARRESEIGKCGGDGRRKHKINTDFSPKVFAEVVAMEGVRFDMVRATVAFILDKEHRYEVELELVPATKKVLAEPPRDTCVLTRRMLPEPCLATCSISRERATAHLMARSAESGRLALPRYAVRCDVTGDTLLEDEAWRSDYSGKVARIAAFTESALSGRKGLEGDFATCEFTGVTGLIDEMLTSDVSGKRFRRDELARSAISDVVGHDSEFVVCAQTGDRVLPTEAGQSAISGVTVRRDLLVASQKPPHRLGLASEAVVCSVTGLVLLTDEATLSAVSGKYLDKKLAVYSQLSGRPGTPQEMVRCEVSKIWLHPDEVDVSEVSGRRVRRDMLQASPISGRQALMEEFKRCEFTGTDVLPSELVRSDESGRWLRMDQAVASAVSDRVGHESETVLCSGLGKPILMSESAQSAISGKRYSKSLLIASDKPPHRLGTAEEVVQCAASGKRLLKDETVRSRVSGKRIDRDLAVPSAVSGRLALPEEMVTCEVSGLRLLPREVEVCAVSGQRVNAKLLVASELSDKRALPSHMEKCEVSGKRVLPQELQVCEVTGKRVVPAQLAICVLTGKRVLPSELLACSVSNLRVVRSELVSSDISGCLMLPKHAVVSPMTKRRCTPSEAAICNWRRKSFPKDELATCNLTGLRFHHDVLNAASELRFLRDLLDGRETGKDGRQLVDWLLHNSAGAVTNLKRVWCIESSFAPVTAVCGEERTFLGFKVRHVGLLVLDEPGDRRIIGRIVRGKRSELIWAPET